MSSANDAVGLANCNGHLWMTTDPHFVLAGLKCKTRVSKMELLSFDMSDCDTCCLTQADSQTIVALRASAANENITSWDLLSVSLREGVNKYCDVADWTVDSTSGTFERQCGASCATDTSDKSSVFGTMPLPIFENFPKTSAFGTSQAYTCASPVIYECPIGFRREIGSALQMLDCEPWQHDTAPSYETQHFVGEYHCFACGVIDCATCDVDARKCQECNPGLFLQDHADDGQLCVSKCVDGFEASTIDTGLSTGKVSNCVAASTVDTALALALGITFGVVLIIGVVAFVAYSRRKKRKSKKLKAHIQVQASKIEELEEFKKQVDGLKQVYDIWPPQSVRHSLIEASSGGTFEFSNHGTNSSVTAEETNSATDSVGWFAVVSTNNTWCLAKCQGSLLSFSVPSLTTPVAMLNPEMMQMVESAFQSHRNGGDSVGTFQRNTKPIAPQPAKGYNSEWYWKEDLARVSAHDPSTVFKPHWIRYAGSVQMELESRYWAWKTGDGPNEHSTDLQDRISSTGTESKAFGTDTGTSYKVFFDSLQQQNQKSGYKREMLRRVVDESVTSEIDEYHQQYYGQAGARVDTETGLFSGVASDGALVPYYINVFPQLYRVVKTTSQYTVTPIGGVRAINAGSLVVEALANQLSNMYSVDWNANAKDIPRLGGPVPSNASAVDISGLNGLIPMELIETGEAILDLRLGQLIEVSKRRLDGFWYGSVLYEKEDDGPDNVGVSGWFDSKVVNKPEETVIQAFRASLGGAGAKDLLPPTTWAQQKSDDMTARLHVVADGAERKNCVDQFHRTMGRSQYSVERVTRIQNLALWQSYAVKRIQIMNRDKHRGHELEKVYAFHGSDADTVPKIYQQGFNRSFCGKNATVYGKGVYFARDASYSSSDTYSRPDANGIKRMLLCRVSHGEFCKGTSGALTPDVLDHTTNRLYDSTVNDVANPVMWVTYHDAQAYPEYLIEFKRK